MEATGGGSSSKLQRVIVATGCEVCFVMGGEGLVKAVSLLHSKTIPCTGPRIG